MLQTLRGLGFLVTCGLENAMKTTFELSEASSLTVTTAQKLILRAPLGPKPF